VVDLKIVWTPWIRNNCFNFSKSFGLSFRKAPHVWKRYVDDTFVLLDKTTLDDFFIHLNEIENSINLTMEQEKDNCISFLDIKITSTDKGTISTTIYRKPTHSNRYLNFNSNHPIEHKSAVINSLVYSANYLISSDDWKELEHIRDVLALTGYPSWLLNRKIKIKETH